MTSSPVLSSTSSLKSSSILSTREFLIRTKTSRGNLNDYEKVIALRIFDDTHHASEEIILKKSDRQNQSVQNKNIDVFQIRTQQKLSESIRRLKLHTTNTRSQRSETERIFLKWIELTDLNTKHTFCFPVDDYLPSSPGDALELTEVHRDSICEENNQEETNPKYLNVEKNRTPKKTTSHQSNDRSSSVRTTTNSSDSDTDSETKSNTQTAKSKYNKLYDIRTKTGHQGFLGIKSLMKANVYLKLYDSNNQSSEAMPLNISRLHQRPFRSNQTDQFQIGTNTKLGPLKKVEIWHDGKKGTQLHCDTLEITDQSNGQIYCFQIKGKFFIHRSDIPEIYLDYLDGDTKLMLTDYDDRRCIDIKSDHQQSSKKDTFTYQNREDEVSIPSSIAATKNQLSPIKQKKTSSTISSSATSITSSNADQTLYKIRTRGSSSTLFSISIFIINLLVGHKGFLSLGSGGTDAKVFIRMHEGEKTTDDILLNNSLTHNNPFEAGHTDVFEIDVPQDISSPDRIEIFHNGKKHDGLYLKWIEIMNMKTLERKWFEYLFI
jgi:hypothetical protein